jgi:hypothetical protein
MTNFTEDDLEQEEQGKNLTAWRILGWCWKEAGDSESARE